MANSILTEKRKKMPEYGSLLLLIYNNGEYVGQCPSSYKEAVGGLVARLYAIGKRKYPGGRFRIYAKNEDDYILFHPETFDMIVAKDKLV